MKKNEINAIFVQNVIFYGDFPQSCKFNATDAFLFDTGGYPVVRSKAGTSPPQLLSEQLAAVMSIARES